MSSITTPAPAAFVGGANPGLLRSWNFDTTFVIGTLAIGLTAAAIVTLRPALWIPILLADLWLLGYHHVVSTYTRLFLDGQTRAEHRAMLTWVPVVVVIAVVAVGAGLGFWALTTTYLYWQWWHYSRQSWGVSRTYSVASEGRVPNHRTSQALFLAVPVWGILWRSAQGSETFLGADLWTVPVPWSVVHIAGLIALGAVLWQVAAWAWSARRGALPTMHVLYTVSHLVIFTAAYVLIPDINYGWLAINIWHNAQYIAFVWYFNNKRHGGDKHASGTATELDGSPPRPRLIERLSQRSNLATYLGGCVLASTVLYVTLGATIVTIVPAIVVYQAINFHHYVVDSAIWKVRSESNRRTIGFVPSLPTIGHHD